MPEHHSLMLRQALDRIECTDPCLAAAIHAVEAATPMTLAVAESPHASTTDRFYCSHLALELVGLTKRFRADIGRPLGGDR